MSHLVERHTSLPGASVAAVALPTTGGRGCGKRAGLAALPLIGGALVLAAVAGLACATTGESAENAPHPAEARLSTLLSQLAMLPTPMRDAACEHLFRANGPSVAPVACFAPGTADEIVAAWKHAMDLAEGFGPRFQPAVRWRATALDPGSAGDPGVPTILTYSFVPDGTVVPAERGQPDRPSDLFAFMNALYGGTANWQPLYHDMFLRWGDVSGLTFVYEPFDDGSRLVDNPGVAGARGDLRMAGAAIDGPSGILAYNYYPSAGDMVIDTSDDYWLTRLGNNSRALRNVLAHEVGHGLGMAHVCPVTTTKLMEPFVSDVFDGIRHDDIRHAHYWYGDVAEPNNSATVATNLGNVPTCIPLRYGAVMLPGVNTPYSSVYSVNDGTDQDWFKITAAGPDSITVTVSPIGLAYDDSPQACGGNPGSCCSGGFINSKELGNLALAVFNSDGSVLISGMDMNGTGAGETLTFPAATGSTYLVRVIVTDSPTRPQSYTLDVNAAPRLASVTMDPPVAATGPAGTPTTVTARITSGSAFINTNNIRLQYQLNSGMLVSTVMTRRPGTTLYVADLPAGDCGDIFAYSVVAPYLNASDGVISVPCSASERKTLRIGEEAVLLADSFNTDQGWTVVNEAVSDGGWERGQPASDGARGDPLVDSDGDGWCYLTGNRLGNSDLDGGPTRLTSPVINAAGYTELVLTYDRWFANNNGDADRFVAEVSNDGGATWQTLETVGTAHAWTPRQFNLQSYILPTNAVRVRFSAWDNPNNSATEVGLDNFRVVARRCVAAPLCYADYDQNGGVDGADVEAFFTDWQAGLSAADTNEDGGVDGQDVQVFFVQWQAGGC